jgi:N4-gp56 family major capsid protein
MEIYGSDRGKSALGIEDQAYIDAQFLKNTAEKTVFDRFATLTKQLPKNVGNTITFERNIPMVELMFFDNLNKRYANGWQEALGMDLYLKMPKNAYEDFVLPEGSSGDEKGDMKSVQMEAGVVPIGMWRSHSEELKTFAKRWNLQREASEQADVASEVIDGFYRDTYLAGATNVFDLSTNAGNDARISSNKFTKAVKQAVLAMQLQKAKPVVRVLGANPNTGTIPIKAGFKMIIDSLAVEELKSNPDFVSVETAGVTADKSDAFNFNFQLEGYIGGCEVYSTPKMYSDEPDQAQEITTEILIMGADHTAQIPLRGMNRMEVIVKSLGENGNDPLNRVGTVGWKAWIGAKVLYPERLAKIKVKFDI